MTNPTSNYGWVLPNSGDLVTDLPADFEVALQGVDTTTKALNPSTTLGDIEFRSATANTNTRLGIGSTGQILTVAGGVPTWAAANPGDITGVTAGTGISGGGTSGDVTVTNSMATAITTAGDLIKGTGSGTFDRLGIGSTGQVLTVASGAPSWATPSSGGMTVIASGSLSGSAVNLTSIPTTYVGLQLLLQGVSLTLSDQITLRLNNDSTGSYPRIYDRIGTLGSTSSTANAVTLNGDNMLDTNTSASFVINLPNYSVTNGWKIIDARSVWFQSTSVNNVTRYGGGYVSNTAITQINILAAGGTFDSGTYTLYGVK